MWTEGAAYIDLEDLGIHPDDLDLTDADFITRHEKTKMKALSRCPLYFYVRQTTKKAGQPRGMFVCTTTGVAAARHYDGLWGPVPWTSTASPSRWLMIQPDEEPVDKPALRNNQQLHFSDGNDPYTINVRWGTTGQYIVPEGNFYDHDCRFITTAPAFQNQNMKFRGKKKIKTGAGFMVRAEQINYSPREYDNHRFKDLEDRQGKPSEFYIPVQYTRPRAIPPSTKATGITLNYPIKGFLLTLNEEVAIPRQYLHPNYDNDYMKSLYDPRHSEYYKK